MKTCSKLVSTLLVAVLLFTVAPLFASAADSADKAGYTDVKGLWCEPWVAQYGYAEIFAGSIWRFYPDQSVTRMEFARLLHKALGININYFAPTDIAEYFDDVQNTDAGASALYDLVTCGIIDVKKQFRPNESLARDELTHWLMNAFYSFAGRDYPIPLADRVPFVDSADIRETYIADVDNAVTLGLLNGRGGNLFYPRAEATRAEAVTVAGRLAELLEEHKAGVTVKAAAVPEDGGLALSLTIENKSEKPVSITHSSQQTHDFVVLDKDGNELYRWSKDRMFAMYVTTTTIPAGQGLQFTDFIGAEDYAAIKSGAYAARAFITGSSEEFAVNPDGYFAALTN
jgi:hypothetical protein